MERRTPLLCRAWAIALLLLCRCGTERTAFEAGHGGTQGAIQGLADTDPATLQKLRDALLADVEVQRTAHELGKALVQGSVEGLHDSHFDAQMQAEVQALADALLLSMRKAGDSALDDLLTRGGSRLEAELQRSLTTLILKNGDVLARTTHDQLEPATNALVRSSVQVAIAELTRAGPDAAKQLSTPVGELTHTAGQEFVLGVREEMPPDEVRLYAKTIGQGLVEGLRDGGGGALKQGVTQLEASLMVAAGLLGLLVIGLTVASTSLLRRHRRARKSLAVVAGQIEKSPVMDESTRKALKKAIREHAEHNGVQDWLSDFLKDRGV
jgi:hypothetical protein